ncbi:MAG: M20/M25/M40 family metallo-hydrolase [Candidatus Roizmanbacteria bacterium]|nr:M20/M25/M40 family metallo-hydrolase [Candidatus Roizmanbacteria bacterium]
MKNLPDEHTLLAELTGLQSVSMDPSKKNTMRETVAYLEKIAKMCGMQTTIIETPTHPLFMATLDSGKPITRCFYSHYDVQPALLSNGWESDPFTLTEHDGKLYGRGTADDKGHIAQLFTALANAKKNKTINSNIIILYEGEEELGSLNFERSVLRLKKQLKDVQVFYILDSSVFDNDTPEILYGLRGIVEYELTISTAKQELHSGLYGNVVPNAALILSQFFASMFNQHNYLTLPHMYDRVAEYTKIDDALLKKETTEYTHLQNKMHLTHSVVPKNRQWYEASKTLPSLDIHGISSGYTDKIKNIIPNNARAVFSIRLVPNQKTSEIHNIVNTYAKQFFKNISYTLTSKAVAGPFVTDIKNIYINELTEIYKKYFPNSVRYTKSGGSIPAAEILLRIFNKPVITTGFCSPDSNLHGPNEHIDTKLYAKGIRVLENVITT